MREQPQTPPTSPHCQARAQASRQSSRQAQAGKPSEMLTEGTEERTWPPGPQHILVSVECQGVLRESWGKGGVGAASPEKQQGEFEGLLLWSTGCQGPGRGRGLGYETVIWEWVPGRLVA